MPDTFKLWCLPQVNVTVAAGGTRQVHGYLNLAGLVAQSCLALCNPMDCGLPAPLSMGFPRQEYWRGLPFPPLQGIFPTQGLNPRLWHLLHCRQILCHWATWEAPDTSITSPILSCISKDVGRKEENMWVLKAIYTFIHQESGFEIEFLILDVVFTLQDYPVAPNWKKTLILVISCDFWAVKITNE